MSFLMGIIIGGLIAYFYLNSKQPPVQGDEQEVRALRSQLDQSNAQLEEREAQLQEKTAESQELAEKFASAEKELGDLRGQLSPVEAATRAVPEILPAEEPAEKAAERLPESPESLDEQPENAKAAEEKPESVIEISEEAPEILEVVEEVAEEVPERIEIPEKQPEIVESSEEPPESVEVEEEQSESTEISEETPESIETAEEPVESPEAEVQVDNLRKIGGIGPKAAIVLNEAGIVNFAQLAQTDVSRLRAILGEAGPAYKGMVPDSWPEQAALAAKEDWDTLKELQDRLDGGRYK